MMLDYNNSHQPIKEEKIYQFRIKNLSENKIKGYDIKKDRLGNEYYETILKIEDDYDSIKLKIIHYEGKIERIKRIDELYIYSDFTIKLNKQMIILIDDLKKNNYENLMPLLYRD